MLEKMLALGVCLAVLPIVIALFITVVEISFNVNFGNSFKRFYSWCFSVGTFLIFSWLVSKVFIWSIVILWG